MCVTGSENCRENIKKSLRRERRKELPPEPQSLAELGVIPEKYRKTLAGDNFLLYDSFDEGDDEGDDEGIDKRTLIFGTRRNLHILAVSKVWFLDGTFKTSPTIFLQVSTCRASGLPAADNNEHP